MRTLRIQVFGIVQGVGFRPFIHRLAKRFNALGTVANKGSLVEIYLQWNDTVSCIQDTEQDFLRCLKKEAPERSFIMKILPNTLDLPKFSDFAIIESEQEAGDIFVSPDIATCDLCQKELFDPNNRRYLHPFINCTACGPRLTILESMPYDRERTSMKDFPMCPACHTEYVTPKTRRFDAQPVCCNDCGPTITLLGTPYTDQEAIHEVRNLILHDQIVAIKGIGGFHLACNAYSETALRELRKRKNRRTKPFAVMFRDLQSIRNACSVDALAEKALTGWQKPILLLKKKQDVCSQRVPLPDLLAPGNPNLGVFLPYTPLHLLLFALPDGLPFPDALVMTSANHGGAPICRETAHARKELDGICGHILTHNRHIRIRADDSVVLLRDASTVQCLKTEKDIHENRTDICDDHPLADRSLENPKRLHVLRRSRGMAPLPHMLPFTCTGTVLGMGSELKNTFCLAKNGLFYLSPHVGDLEDLRTVQALEETLRRLEDLLRMHPTCIACDMHPRYTSTALARRLADEQGIPCIPVQHHYAHILSCMAENERLEPVIGLAFDGTGYGLDGTIWGGEVLIADPATCTRFAHIAPFPQTGGDAASRECWRIALCLLYDLYGDDTAQERAKKFHIQTEEITKIHLKLTQKKINTVLSTSAGRLFDGLAALLCGIQQSYFEGEAAMCLQFAAEKRVEEGQKRLNTSLRARFERIFEEAFSSENEPFVIPTHELVRFLIEERLQGEDPALLAYLFHAGLAIFLAKTCEYASEKTHIRHIAISGGVFQNTLLEALVLKELSKQNHIPLIQSTVPANDGGLALGQAFHAAYLRKTDS